MSKLNADTPITERLISLKQYQQVMVLSSQRMLTQKIPTFDVATLNRALAWTQECDRQPDEMLTFEVNPAEPLDQKLMGWRYFKALNAIRKAVEDALADRAADEVFAI